MTTIERANQLSDATFSNIEVAFYYLFATPIGWTFWGVLVLAFLVVWGMLADHEKIAAAKERAARGERLRAEQVQNHANTLGGPTGPLADYRSPAGYNRGVLKD